MTEAMKCQIVFAIESDAEQPETASKAARKIGLECSPIAARATVARGQRRIELLSPGEPVACSDVPELLRWAPKLMLSVRATASDNVELYYVTEHQVVRLERQPGEARSVFVGRDCFASCAAFAKPHSAVFSPTEACPGWLQDNMEFFCDVQKMLIWNLVKDKGDS